MCFVTSVIRNCVILFWISRLLFDFQAHMISEGKKPQPKRTLHSNAVNGDCQTEQHINFSCHNEVSLLQHRPLVLNEC